MPGSRYSFLDLTVLAELRRRVLAPEATVLFADDMLSVLWANAPGAALFGGTDLAELIDVTLSPSQPFVRQLRDAVTQIEDEAPLVRGFRVARGLRTEFIQCELSRIKLPGGEDAVLLVTTGDRFARPAREHELAAKAVDSLVGFSTAAAIVDDYGLAIAATGGFAEVDLAPEDLGLLIEEAAKETDRLVKRVVELGDGDMIAVGVARLRERPGRYLLVCADASDEEGAAPADIAADEDNTAAGAEPFEHTWPEAEESETDTATEAALAGEPVIAPSPEPVAFDGERRELVPPAGWEDPEPDDSPETGGEAFGAQMATAPHAEPLETMPAEPVAMAPDGTPAPLIELREPDWPDEAEDDEAAEVSTDESGAARDDEAAAEAASPADAPAPVRKPSLLDRWYLRLSDEGTPAASAAPVREKDEDAGKPAVEASPEAGVAKDADAGALAEESRAEPAAGGTAGAHAGQDDASPPREDEAGRPAAAAEPDAGREAPVETAEPEGFVFKRDGDPVRFAWIIDSDQTFRSVSPELAQTVGPNAADIVGRKWPEVSAVFGFDNSGEIRRLLERRDTWSGKSVMWPVQGTDLVVPIDLAALPAFDATRQFDGFRGFGIIRVSDAAADPNETGLALVPARRDEHGPAEDAPYGDGGQANDDRAGESGPAAGEEAEQARVEDRRIAGRSGEAEPARENASANVVHLPPRTRTGTHDELSRRESLAFNEIGRTLRSDGEPANDVDVPAAQGSDGPAAAGSRTEPVADAAQGPAAGRDEPPAAVPGAAANDSEDSAVDAERAARDSDVPGGGSNSILEQLPVPVLIYRNGVTLYANPELLDLTGYDSVEELSSAGGVDVLLSGHPEQGHATLICKDGRSIEISPLLQTVPWNDAAGSAGKALLLSFRPTPARGGELPPDEKIALDVARVAELQNILDTATDGILIAGRDASIESINASAEALFGLDLDQAVGRPLSDLFAQESHKILADYMADLTQPGVASILNDGREVIGKEANGGLIPLFITIGPVGAAEKFCVVLRDMTHWKKAEEELVNAKRAAELASEQKTDFLARVSHEIRTPLNAIIGFSDVMLEERFGPIGSERYREYLRDINRSGVHVLDLINDLLDISKIEAGKMELTYEAVDLNQIVAETVALLQPQANRERIIIRTSLSRAVPRVVADARSIRQIILNLVSNAIKFTPENGQVIVSTVYEGNGEVALRVRDTGKGMSPAEIDNAMKPFQQLRGVDEKRGQGTGLGLPLTKALVEANRAYFDLESTPGEGTIAHMHFPIQRVLAD